MKLNRKQLAVLDKAAQLTEPLDDLVRNLSCFTYSSARLETYRAQLNDMVEKLISTGISP